MNTPYRDVEKATGTLPLEPEDEARLWIKTSWRRSWRGYLALLFVVANPIACALLPFPASSHPRLDMVYRLWMLVFWLPFYGYVFWKYVQNRRLVRSLERRGYAVPKWLGGSD